MSMVPILTLVIVNWHVKMFIRTMILSVSITVLRSLIKVKWLTERIKELNEDKLDDLIKNRSKCEYSGKQFVSTQVLQVRISGIHKKDTFKCELCDRTFTTKSSRYAHTNEQHALSKSFQCKYCEEHFYKIHQRDEFMSKLVFCAAIVPDNFCQKNPWESTSTTYTKMKKNWNVHTAIQNYQEVIHMTEHIRILHLVQKFKCSSMTITTQQMKFLLTLPRESS